MPFFNSFCFSYISRSHLLIHSPCLRPPMFELRPDLWRNSPNVRDVESQQGNYYGSGCLAKKCCLRSPRSYFNQNTTPASHIPSHTPRSYWNTDTSDTSVHRPHNRLHELPRLPSSALLYPPPTIPLPLPAVAPLNIPSPYSLNPRLFLEPAKNQRVICSLQKSHTSPKPLRHPEEKRLVSQYDKYMDHDFTTLLGFFPLPPSYIPHHDATRSPTYHCPPLTPKPRLFALNSTTSNMNDLEQTVSDLEVTDDEFWSDACPWEQEFNPTNLSSQNRKKLTTMNRAFDIVSQCEWIMKNTPRIDADSLANIAEASDPSIGADDRSTDSASFSMSPMLVESHPFPLTPKAHAQNPEPIPSQYLISEFANFPDEILADDERDDEIDHQQSHIVKRTRAIRHRHARTRPKTTTQ